MKCAKTLFDNFQAKPNKLIDLKSFHYPKLTQYYKALDTNKMDEDYEMFKIVVIGSMGTGKTNISTRYIRN